MTLAETDGDVLFREALDLQRNGDLEQAIAAYHRLGALIPDAAPVFVNMGLAYKTLGRLSEAEAALRQAVAIDPQLGAAHDALGTVLKARGRFTEAETALRLAETLDPAAPDAPNNLGALLDELGRHEEAEAAFRRAIANDPGAAQPQVNLGAVLLKLRRPNDAAAACRAALFIHPADADAENNLGNALVEMGEIQQAMAAYQRALNLRPDFAQAGTNLAAVFHDLGRYEEAVSLLVRVIAANPGFAFAYNNLGNTLFLLDRLSEAEAAFRKALSLTPNDAQAHFNLASLLLKKGRFAEGWREYEWRKKTDGSPLRLICYPQPVWDGSPLAGRTLLLYAEQGLGDCLQFCRFAPIVAAKMGGPVLLQVHPPLARLLANLPGTVRVLAFDQPLPAFDCHQALMSLPGLLKTEFGSIPADIPYLVPDPDDVAMWAKRVAPLKGLKVGLVWAGEPRPKDQQAHRLDIRRSLRLDQFAPLAVLPGISFVSLQLGAAAEQAHRPPLGMTLVDWTEKIHDMADTAAVVANLDLVITVDTAVAHLAGALGKPVWVLSRFDGCWRWLRDRDDSPWYPTVRLFRQPRFGDWTSVMVDVAAHLAAFGQGS